MKQTIDKLLKNPYWLIFLVFISPKDVLKYLFLKLTQQSKMSFTEVINHIDWGNFIVLFIIITILYFQIRKNNKLKAKVDFLERRIADVDKRWSTEVVNNIYPKLIRLTYRVECIMGHNREEWHPQREKEKVEAYFKSDTHGLTVQELSELMAKHFLELPNVI